MHRCNKAGVVCYLKRVCTVVICVINEQHSYGREKKRVYVNVLLVNKGGVIKTREISMAFLYI